MKRFLFILIALASCTRIFQPTEDDPVIARAGDKYLRKSDLAARIPVGMSERDSLTLVQNYINKWVQNEILTQKAKGYLSSSEQDFTQQMEEYKNSLLLFEFEQKLVTMYLDTSVTDSEIENYYLENKSQFELKGNILKFDYIKLNKRSKYLKEFRKLMKSSGTQDRQNLVNYAEKYATDYWFPSDWIAMNQLLSEMPLEVDNQPLFLRRTQYTEAEDSLFIYLLRINDYKTTDSISPLEFEKDKIRNIILNSRKIDLLDKKRQEFIDDAFQKNQVEIY